jgi:CheY-like chemotaxis protein
MPVGSRIGSLRWRRRTPQLALTALACALSPAAQSPAPQSSIEQLSDSPARLTLEELGARRPPDYSPLHAGKTVLVEGVVSAAAFHFPAYALLPFEDAGYGAVVEGTGDGREVDGYAPGDEIEVEGVVSSNAGMVILVPDHIRLVGRQAAPRPHRVSPEELLGFRHLGRLIETEARVIEVGDTTAGPYLLVATTKGDYRLFLPRARDARLTPIRDIRVGDTLHVVGVALQYCPTPPYNRWFELLVHDQNQLARTNRVRLVHPATIAAGLGGAFLLALLLWTRDRRLRRQRERFRGTYELGERILGASSVEAILGEISAALPPLLGISRVALYVFNRGARTLEAVAAPLGAENLSISLSSPPGGTHAGAAACFHYRTLLAIPDIDRSPFPIAPESGSQRPKSVLFVPMLSQSEVVGVLELDQDDRARDFTPDEQALAQHLGNQIGVAVRLLDQRTVQEHLFRTEKLAAVGRLISGVVNELQQPLASIVESANRALAKSMLTVVERDLIAIATGAQKASAIVSRLVSFATAEQGEARPVCVSTLLRNLIEFREREWKASGIRVRDLTSIDSLYVLGSHGQLEQAFLTLLVHAEQCLTKAPLTKAPLTKAEDKTITIRSSPMGRRLLVEIAFSVLPDGQRPEEIEAVLSVTSSVIEGHGGEVRLNEKNHAEPRFEVELPLTARERALAPAPPRESSRTAGTPATVLLIEAEETVQRQMRDQLAAYGCRVVPVTNADTALELAQRMRFDAAFCSVHAPGLNWVELSERLQSRVGCFVLLSDRFDAELATDFEGDGRFVLTKPLEDAGLQRVLAGVDGPVGTRGQAV